MTGAPDPLITLAEAKAHLEYADSDRDSYITALCAAATAMLDGPYGMIGKAVGEQVWTYAMRYAPVGNVSIPVFPVKALQSVTYFDAANVSQTINVNQFRLVANEDYAYLEPVTGFVWPALYDRADAITITVQLGMPEVPAGIKHAALLMVSNWFENREAVADKAMLPVPFAIETLINRWRVGWVAG
jgi:uncharacterized phiE125 gp8 family phage protein